MLAASCVEEKEERATPSSEWLEVIGQVAFQATDTEKSLEVTADCHWTVSVNEAWEGLTVTPLEGDGTERLTITTPANSTRANRQSTLTVNSKGGITKSVRLSQTMGEVSLTVTPRNVTATATDTLKTFVVDCNDDWRATAADDWPTLIRISGTQADTLKVRFSQNYEQQPRSTTIIIRAGSQKSDSVSLSQDAATLPDIRRFQAASVERYEATFIVDYESQQFPVTEYGLCYSQTNVQPTQSDAVVSAQGGKLSEATTLTLTGLESGSTYHVRAYARSVVGLVYSDAVTISTAGSVPGEDDNPMPNPK